ncbi:MAG: caspase family protein [Deltaproteobacteria bacterium]|nr:caspase family protein [Deltaproteobacteria bacterium]
MTTSATFVVAQGWASAAPAPNAAEARLPAEARAGALANPSALATLADATLAPAPKALFGLVVGYNFSADAKDLPLRYADDDAMANAELLGVLGAHVVLLTELDSDTQRLYPGHSPTTPTLAAWQAAMATLDNMMEQAQRRGLSTELFVMYSGHGSVQQTEGYVQLADGRLTRSVLRDALSEVHADRVHLVVDACKSFFLVFPRGVGGERHAASKGFLAADMPLPPHVGVILSTSSAADSHEWEGYQAGVFSHELRSALRGPADFDGDGVVTYDEAAAFIYTANAAIPNARYRPQVFARAPRDDAALVSLRRSVARRLKFTGADGAGHHWYIEDELGRRVADLNPGQDMETEILLPPKTKIFVRQPLASEERVFDNQDATVVTMRDLERRPTTSTARGAEHEAFGRLFLTPFDRRAMRSWRDSQVQRTAAPPVEDSDAWVDPVLVTTGAVALVGGVVLSSLSLIEKAKYSPDLPHADRVKANEHIRTYNRVATVGYGVGAVAAVLFLARWIHSNADNAVVEPNVEVIAAPGVGGVGMLWRY